MGAVDAGGGDRREEGEHEGEEVDAELGCHD